MHLARQSDGRLTLYNPAHEPDPPRSSPSVPDLRDMIFVNLLLVRRVMQPAVEPGRERVEMHASGVGAVAELSSVLPVEIA